MPLVVPALTVHQWMPGWDEADFDESSFRRRPPSEFLMLTLPADTLRSLVGIYRRSAEGGQPRARDLGIQRAHDSTRSDEIREYVKHGFPWSSLPAQKRRTPDYRDLVKPGWLPTALVVNILTAEDSRDGRAVDPSDLITVGPSHGGRAEVTLPKGAGKHWAPRTLPPLEVIDGQHRLWAFDDSLSDYDLPVVAFHGLDRSWQAYLFYTINIKPKRINTSLAFDLYPLLRTEDWLEKFEGHSIYRETRAQELTEALWSNHNSPWFDRINMLGARGSRSVTQASWIRSLQATIVKSWEGRRVQIGGLYGAPAGEHRLMLPWSRAQQAALIFAWNELKEAILGTDEPWAQALRDVDSPSTELDMAFAGPSTMTNSDIGVRGYLYILNDLCYIRADELGLWDWEAASNGDATAEVAVNKALASLALTPVADFVRLLAQFVAQYDWRSSKAPGLSDPERRSKARFRGGTGYRELRQELVEYLMPEPRQLGKAAAEVAEKLGYVN